MTGWPDLWPHTEEIARRLLGQPNERLSTRDQLRFGTNGSLAVEIAGPKHGEWFDHEGQVGGGPWQLLTIKGGMTNGAAIEWLRSQIGIEIAPASPRIVNTYDYCDEQGELLFQVVRFDPKDFRQRRPDGNGGWIWQVKGARQVPYRLKELIAAPLDTSIFVVEGEKDADNLGMLGLVATCNAGGAAKRRNDGKPGRPKWRPELDPFFHGREVIFSMVVKSSSYPTTTMPVATMPVLSLPTLSPSRHESAFSNCQA
jgi:putative DNA primase/helicase